jgi:lycopene cyclase-like protein
MCKECTYTFVDGNRVQPTGCPVRILGAGPAGLSLAAELGSLGVPTTVVAEHPSAPWEASYGTFEPLLPERFRGAIRFRFERPEWVDASGERHVLDVPYVRLSSDALQAELLHRAHAGGIQFEERRVDVTEERTDTSCLIIDALGRSRADSDRHTVFQCAFGVWAKLETGPWLKEGEMLFMDLRRAREDGPPTFLYAMREGPLHFLQETVLVGPNVTPFDELKARLHARIGASGIKIGEVVREERCLIAMGGRPLLGTGTWVPFGAAAGQTQPASGYQIARTLDLSVRLARVVASGPKNPLEQAKNVRRLIWPWSTRAKWSLFNYGANALAEMSQSEVTQFLSLFCAEPGSDLTEFIDGRLPLPRVLRLMARVYQKSDSHLRQRLLPRASLFAC